jgi:hypothetical protein
MSYAAANLVRGRGTLVPVGLILCDGGALRRGNVRHCSWRDELPELVLCWRVHSGVGTVLSRGLCEP